MCSSFGVDDHNVVREYGTDDHIRPTGTGDPEAAVASG